MAFQSLIAVVLCLALAACGGGGGGGGGDASPAGIGGSTGASTGGSAGGSTGGSAGGGSVAGDQLLGCTVVEGGVRRIRLYNLTRGTVLPTPALGSGNWRALADLSAD